MTNLAHTPQAGNAWNRRRLQSDLALHLVGGVPILALALFWGGSPWQALGTAALAYAVSAAIALKGIDRHAPHAVLGAANQVTLLRGLIVAVAAGALPGAPGLGIGAQWLLAVLTFLALLLDGLDGWLARRSGMVSRYGAALDADMDTVAIAVLVLLLWRLGDAGAWIVVAALLRPAFVVAGLLVPAMARPLPPSGRRRVVCGVLVGTLSLCIVPVLQPPWSSVAAGTALALLLFSFVADTVWLLSAKADRHHARTAEGPNEAFESDR